MINFTCATLACLQMHLGVGAIVHKTHGSLIYYSSAAQQGYICRGSISGAYQCTPLAAAGERIERDPTLRWLYGL